MLEIGLSRLRMCQISLQDLHGGVFRFSGHPDTGNCRPHFFDPTGPHTITAVRIFSTQLDRIRLQRPIGSKTTYFSIRSPTAVIFTSFRSKKCRRRFLATGPLTKRGTPPDRSWRELRHILRQECDQFPTFRGQRLLRTR